MALWIRPGRSLRSAATRFFGFKRESTNPTLAELRRTNGPVRTLLLISTGKTSLESHLPL